MRHATRLTFAAVILLTLGACRLADMNRVAIARFVADAIVNGVAAEPHVQTAVAPRTVAPSPEGGEVKSHCPHQRAILAVQAALLAPSGIDSGALRASLETCPKQSVPRRSSSRRVVRETRSELALMIERHTLAVAREVRCAIITVRKQTAV